MGLRRGDLRGLQRLHRHRDRPREAAGVPVPAELQPPLQRTLAPGLLATLAYDAVALAPRLPVYPPRGVEEGRDPHLRQHHGHDGPRWALAWGGVDVRALG